ncbi:DnaJ-domain-containing protein, partial [Eremomyces bilateralis CBS 781.70]
ATTKDVKRQFYALSKRCHPDTHASRPDASKKDAESRFHRISEAYHILAHDSRRAKYDRDYHRIHGNGAPPTTPHGTHSSHQSRSRGPAGSRPASGLSPRRGVFKGPPPSFYRQYGQEPPREGDPAADADARGTTGRWGGFSPGQADPDWRPDPYIPHWDRTRHLRTQERILERGRERR